MKSFYFVLKPTLAEHTVWENYVAPQLIDLPDNVLSVWNYCFTEIFNNAIDHSDGTSAWVLVDRRTNQTRITVGDDGEGIFQKIRRSFGLKDPRQAILELVKGKLTTDPSNHTGEGIFFSSRAVDQFAILSRGIAFVHDCEANEDWFLQAKKQYGTSVIMELANDSPTQLTEVFDDFTSDDGDFGFDKTIVPVRLAAEDGTRLISRSQAKRLLARIDRFKNVIFDFASVTEVGQGFADQVFRVFAKQHPDVRVDTINAIEPVQRMINRAKAAD